MHRTLFALFPDERQASRTVDAILARCLRHEVHPRPQVRGRIDTRRSLDLQGLEWEQTDATPAFRRGLLLGAATGAAVGLALTGLRVLDFGVGWVVSLGAILGLLAGGLSAVLVGAGGVDRSLGALEDRNPSGRILVTLDVPDEATAERVADLLRRRGIRFALKHA